MLDWLRDPAYTTVRVIGPGEGHLRDNLFTHLVTLHRSASIKLPGNILDLFIGLDPRARKSAMTGVVIPAGKKTAGKLQGGKRVQRPRPHPVFGPLTRMRIFVDEIENVNDSLWGDIDNVISQVEGPHSFKLIGAFNPRDINSQVASRAEPPGGWQDGFDIETSETWDSRRGWRVVRLDAMKCENVIAGKTIYKGLQTREGIERTIRNQGGIHSPGYYAMVRACYPPAGVSFNVIPQDLLNRLKCEVVFYDRPRPASGVDVALTGSAAPKMAVGRFGRAVSIRIPPCLAHPRGAEVFFTDAKGRKAPRNVLVVDTLFTIPVKSGEEPTIALAKAVMDHAKRFGVEPGWLMLDKTGNGAGVLDAIRTLWSREVRGVNYSENPTKLRIMEDDEQTCDKLFDRVVTELWIALRKWIEFGFLYISPILETEELYHQISDRREDTSGKKRKVESKPEYKSRNEGISPDEADAVTLLLHAVRAASGFLPAVVGAGSGGDGEEGNGDEDPICDVTNRYDDYL
jgi:hypothetical protein